MDRISLIIIIALFFSLLVFHYSYGDTKISYSGMPSPAAISPSISSFNNKMCRTGISGAYSGGIFSASGGTTIVDETCEKVTLAASLDSLGLKVAAVSVLCQDPRVWDALEMSGTTCPFGGAVQDAARQAWFERHPERFEKLYGKDWTPPTVTYPLSD